MILLLLLFVGLIVFGIGAVDLVQRNIWFTPGLWMVGLCGLPPLLVLPRPDWDALGATLEALGATSQLLLVAAVVAGILLGLSRALRPESPVRWRKGKLAVALAAGLIVSVVLILEGAAHALAGLPFVWMCTPLLLAFAKDGGPRVERGGAIAIALLVTAWVAGVGSQAAPELGWSINALLNGYPPLALTFPWLGVLTLLVAVPTLVAIWRRPDPFAFLPVLPCVGVWLVSLWNLAVLPNAAETREPVPELRDLLGQPAQYRLIGEDGAPTPCVQHMDPQKPERCNPAWSGSIPWVVPPSLPLSELPDGGWVVHRQIPFPFGRLGFRYLRVIPQRHDYGQSDLYLEEVGGEARLAKATFRVPSAGDGWWQGVVSLPLGPRLHERLQRFPLAIPSRLRIELPRTPRWTVQDAISICASFMQEGYEVICAVVPPAGR